MKCVDELNIYSKSENIVNYDRTLCLFVAVSVPLTYDYSIDIQVEFSISESKRNNNKIAVNVKLMSRSSMTRHLGFVATIKDAFGFIETAEHDREVFFHFR
jgi:hypothetical protein